MYLKRKIDEYLLEWKKNEERLPLIIKGARQIGKTESINHFAEQNYSNIVSINFVLEPKYKTILSDGYAVEDIIKNISMIDTSKRFIAGDTVIIFDELQEFPDIATALKSFRIDGRFDVICSGSLLEINYRSFQILQLRLRHLRWTEDLMLYVAVPCLESITEKFIVTVWDTKQIMKCFRWILKNFCGQKDTQRSTLKIS